MAPWIPIEVIIFFMIHLYWQLVGNQPSIVPSLYSVSNDWFPPPHLVSLENHAIPQNQPTSSPALRW